MATSGTSIWTLNRDQVISGALRKLGVLPSGGVPSTNQVSDASTALNALVKAFQADGMPVWAINQYTFTTVAGTSLYLIGVGQTLNTPRPLKVLEAHYTLTGNSRVPMHVENRYDFKSLPNASTVTGTPVTLYYHPLVDTGAIHLWPIPIDSTTTITLNYQRPFEDLNSATDTFDFPPYWIQALIYNLAWTMAPEFGLALTERNAIRDEAQFWKMEALSYGSEEGSLTISPTTE